MSKQEEIKQALAAATPGPWAPASSYASDSEEPDGIIFWAEIKDRPGAYTGVCEFHPDTFVKDEDVNLMAKAPEYIAYLLEENERLEKRNQELDEWSTEGFEENKKLVDERDRLRERFEEKNSRHTKAIRLLMHVTEILSMGRTPDRAGAALQEIYKWLHENNPVGQEGEGNQ